MSATTGQTLTVRIPGVLSYDLTPNARGVSGWRRSKLVAELRKEIAWEVLAQVGNGRELDPDRDYALSVAIAWPVGRRALDDDNALACTKLYRDQLVQSLGLSSDRRVRTVCVTQARSPAGDYAGSVTLTLEEA